MARKVRKLKTLNHLRLLLSDTVCELEKTSSLADLETAKVVIHAARVLGELMRGAKVEERLDLLERNLQGVATLGIPTTEFFKDIHLSPRHKSDESV